MVDAGESQPVLAQARPDAGNPRPERGERPERNGDEQRRGRRGRGRDRHRGERRDQVPAHVDPSVVEAQRRIHELESQREQEPQHAEPRHEEPRHEEPRREEPRHEEPRREEPRHEEPRIDAKKDLEDAGLVMIESRAPTQPIVEEQVQLGRPRRERVRPPSQDEDLQQVETGKK